MAPQTQKQTEEAEKYLNALNKLPGVGARKIKTLLDFFSGAEQAWKADLKDLKQSGIGEKLAENIFPEIQKINPEEEWERMEKENVRMITLNDASYPSLLKESHNPPYILYVKSADNNFNFNASPAVAVVGARKNSEYGALAAQNLAKNLATAGITIISGMALGIDGWAHRGALDGNGKTIAVLGNSLDDENIYPRNHFNFSREIMQAGALVSEYPIETKAGPLTFPARNRIIAGMSLGTIVVEAAEKSGALLTAHMALEANREVFAVPGPIFSESSLGANRLIRSGAKIVTGIKDILEELNLEEAVAKKEIAPKNPENREEEILMKILSGDPLHIDNIARLAKLQTAQVASALAMMEIKGWIKNIGGQNYILI